MNFFFPHFFATSPRNLETAGVAADPHILTGSRIIRAVDSTTLFEGFADYLALIKGKANTDATIGVVYRPNFSADIRAYDFAQSEMLLRDLPNGGTFRTTRGVYGVGRNYILGNIETSNAVRIFAAGNDSAKFQDYLWEAVGGNYGDGGVFYGDVAGTRRVADVWPSFQFRHPIKGDDVDAAWDILKRRAVLAFESTNPGRNYTANNGNIYYRYKDEGTEYVGSINSTWRVRLADVAAFLDYPSCAVEFVILTASIYDISTGSTKYHYFVMKVPMLTKSTANTTITFYAAGESGDTLKGKFRQAFTSIGYNVDDSRYIFSVSVTGGDDNRGIIVLDAHKMLINRLIWS